MPDVWDVAMMLGVARWLSVLMLCSSLIWWDLIVERLSLLAAPPLSKPGFEETSWSSRRLVDNNDTVDASQDRIYFLKRVAGPGCPYTASWLAHVNLYRRVKYWIDITKMEAATFSL
ncbi:hypothetical protein EON65_26595 [archaeon]|nr:MAG: hypothetical protein EON65_26595 [archaeon]